MTWQTALALMIVISATSILVQRNYAQKSKVPASIPVATSYVLGVVPVGLIAGFLVFPHSIRWSWWVVLLIAICGLSMAVSNIIGFHVSKHITVVANATIGRFSAVVTIVLGWILLGEKLTTWQIIGGAILMLAALLAIWAPAKTSSGAFKHLQPGVVVLALISCAALAFGLVSEKGILGHMDIGGVFLVGWTAQALSMALIALKDISAENLRAFRGYELRRSVLMGILNGLTGTFYVYAIFRSDNISLVTTILPISLPLTILGAYLLLHEREHHALMWISLGVSCLGLAVSAIH
jgi:drug/metabolite transporter (DMT)-like permease